MFRRCLLPSSLSSMQSKAPITMFYNERLELFEKTWDIHIECLGLNTELSSQDFVSSDHFNSTLHNKISGVRSWGLELTIGPLRSSQVRKRWKIGFKQSLTYIHPPSLHSHPDALFIPLQLSKQKLFLGKTILGGGGESPLQVTPMCTSNAAVRCFIFHKNMAVPFPTLTMLLPRTAELEQSSLLHFV
jgi:hypothetical protein